MKIRVCLLIIALLLVGQPGWAASRGFYMGLHGGPAKPDDMDLDVAEISYETGYLLGATAGYDFGFLRVEGELAYRKNDLDEISRFGFEQDLDGSVTSTILVGNCVFEYDNRTPLIPYGGIGVGIGRLDFDDISAAGVEIRFEDDLTTVAQIMVGLGYRLSDQWRLNADYRAMMISISSEDDEDDDSVDDDYFSSSLSLGVSYMF